MNNKETKRNYNNKRRVALALLRQLGTVKKTVTVTYRVSIPQAVLNIPALKRQVKKAARALGDKVVLD
jgi:hypothetical protein